MSETLKSPEQKKDPLYEKEGRFHGGVEFDPKDLIGIGRHDIEGKLVVTSLVVDQEGKLKIKKGIYDKSKVPEGVDPAEFDYMDTEAECYDNDPEIEILDIDIEKIRELLRETVKELRADIRQAEEEQDEEDDEWESHKMDDLVIEPLMRDLDEVRKLRVRLREQKG